MNFYSQMADTALQMLTQFGQKMIIEDKDGSFEVTGTVEDFSYKDAGIGFAANSSVERNDKKISIAAKGLSRKPTTKSYLVADDTKYKIMNVKETSPAGIPIIYELQGRA